MKDFQELQNKIEALEKENQYLKSLLDHAGIIYETSISLEDKDLFDQNQGARIIHKDIT